MLFDPDKESRSKIETWSIDGVMVNEQMSHGQCLENPLLKDL